MSSFSIRTDARMVEQALARIPPAMQGQTLVDATMAGGEHLAQLARNRVRVGKTRRLLRAIKARVERRRRTEVEVAVSFKEARASRTPAFHGFFVELGTDVRKRHRTGRGSTGRMPASPFLRPAFDEGHQHAQHLAANVLRRRLEGLG